MKLVATIRPTETRELVVEIDGDDYDGAKAEILAQVPEGWQIQGLRRRKD